MRSQERRRRRKRQEERVRTFDNVVDTIQSSVNTTVDTTQKVFNEVVDKSQAMTTDVMETVEELGKEISMQMEKYIPKLKPDQLLLIALQMAKMVGDNSFLKTWNIIG